MPEQALTWDDVRRFADEVQLKLHLGGMDARDRWRALQPRVHELERALARLGRPVGDAVAGELATVADALRQLRDDLAGRRTP